MLIALYLTCTNALNSISYYQLDKFAREEHIDQNIVTCECFVADVMWLSKYK